jgi:hypothetical protein
MLEQTSTETRKTDHRGKGEREVKNVRSPGFEPALPVHRDDFAVYRVHCASAGNRKTATNAEIASSIIVEWLPTTWIDSPGVEAILLGFLSRADNEFSESFTTQALSNEERLTGDLTRLLQERARLVNPVMSQWGQGKPGSVHFSLSVVDTTVGRSEKINGADMAFILHVDIPNSYHRDKAIFVQAKKMNATTQDGSITFHSSWDVDRTQLDNLIRTTPFGYYFLYGPSFNSTRTRVIPAQTVKAITSAASVKGVIHQHQVMPSSRSLAEFLVYDFIGCWVGDESDSGLQKARGKDPEFPVRHLIKMQFTLG